MVVYQKYAPEKKGEEETVRFLQAGCKKYGKFMHQVIKKINEEYRDVSIEKGTIRKYNFYFIQNNLLLICPIVRSL